MYVCMYVCTGMVVLYVESSHCIVVGVLFNETLLLNVDTCVCVSHHKCSPHAYSRFSYSIVFPLRSRSILTSRVFSVALKPASD